MPSPSGFCMRTVVITVQPCVCPVLGVLVVLPASMADQDSRQIAPVSFLLMHGHPEGNPCTMIFPQEAGVLSVPQAEHLAGGEKGRFPPDAKVFKWNRLPRVWRPHALHPPIPLYKITLPRTNTITKNNFGKMSPSSFFYRLSLGLVLTGAQIPGAGQETITELAT